MSEAIIVARANGVGKTTFARQLLPLLHPGVPFLNAEEIRLEAAQFQEPVAAARELLRRLRAAELAGGPLAVETTLSSRTYGGLVVGTWVFDNARGVTAVSGQVP